MTDVEAKPFYAVIGASGPTGLEVVKRLLDVSELPVRAVVRNPSKYKELIQEGPKLQVAQADVTDRASLEAALKGARGVVFAAAGKTYWSPKQVDFEGVKTAAEVAKAAGVERFVLVSSMLVTRKNWLHPIRMILNNIRYSLLDFKLKGEDALRASGVSYTVVRPSGLGKGPGGAAKIVAEQGDKNWNPGSINRADVAAVCVEALTNPAAANVTLEVTSKPAPPSHDYKENLRTLFDGLQRNT